MSVSDHDLTAYADGELSGADAARVEAALATDPELARRLAAERRLRQTLRAHLDPVCDEPVPEAMTAMIAAAAGAQPTDPASRKDAVIIDFAQAQAKRADAARRPVLQRWGTGIAIAASLVLGIMLGGRFAPVGTVVDNHGRLFASGQLAHGLDVRLASAPGEAGSLRILASFKRQGGDYCRVFESGKLAGIACKDETGWTLERTQSSGGPQVGEYRQAGSTDADLMAAAQDMATGSALDPAQEKAALAAHWMSRTADR